MSDIDTAATTESAESSEASSTTEETAIETTATETNTADTTETTDSSESTETAVAAEQDFNWIQHVPAEHLPTAQKYKTLGEFVKAHGEVQSKLGTALFMPGKDASDEDKAKFFERLGRPKSAELYKAPEVEGVSFDEGRQRAFFDAAHGIGLTQGQVEALMTWELEGHKSAKAAAEKAHVQAHGKLEESWGEDAVANYEKARRVGDILFTEAQRKSFGMGEDPKTWSADLVAALSSVSPSFMDHPHLGKAQRDLGKDADELSTELDELMAKPDYYQNQSIQKRVREINEALHGTRSIHPAAA